MSQFTFTRVVFFDFDGTLTRTDTVLPFIRFCYNNPLIFYLKLLMISPILLAYLAKWVSNQRAKEAVFRTFLRGWTNEQFYQFAQQFAQTQLPQLLRPEGMEKLKFHQKQGDKCILVSASLQAYLQVWGEINGFHGVLATELATENHILTGELHGENCHDWGKVRRIEQVFGQIIWQNSMAYSDSLVDLPMLQHAQTGFLWDKKTRQFLPI